MSGRSQIVWGQNAFLDMAGGQQASRNVPANRPLVTGGVNRSPSRSSTRFAMLVSVNSPRSFQRITSSQSGRDARATSYISRRVVLWIQPDHMGIDGSLGQTDPHRWRSCLPCQWDRLQRERAILASSSRILCAAFKVVASSLSRVAMAGRSNGTLK